MANIIKIARMIMALEDDTRSKEKKADIINMYKQLGVITEEDAKELIVEYCYE